MKLNESQSSNELEVSLTQTNLNSSITLNSVIVQQIEFPNISMLLKKIISHSKLKTLLAHILGFFHEYPFLLILIEIILGLIFIGLPFYLIVYLNIFDNKIISLFIIISISFIISFSLIFIRIIDDRKHHLSSIAKWQRNNILSNLGLSVNLLIAIFPTFFIFKLYNDLNGEFMNNKGNNDYKLIFLNNFILDLYFFTNDKKINKNIAYINNEINIINIIRDNLFYASIPLLLLCFFKLVKILLIELKYLLEQIIFYLSGFLLSLLNIILFIKNIDNQIISLSQFIIITLSLFIYIIWIIHSSNILTIIKKGDKDFGIKKYKKIHLFIIFIFDLLLISGTSMIFAGIILYYIKYYKYINNDEKIENIDLIKFLFNLGFISNCIGFFYYYGKHLMKIIMKPISYEFVPSELKNGNYIRVDINNKFTKAIKVMLLEPKKKIKKY